MNDWQDWNTPVGVISTCMIGNVLSVRLLDGGVSNTTIDRALMVGPSPTPENPCRIIFFPQLGVQGYIVVVPTEEGWAVKGVEV